MENIRGIEGVIAAIDLIRKADQSFTVTDINGEIYYKTSGDLKKDDYSVWVVNFCEFNKGFFWNPLSVMYDYYHDHDKERMIKSCTSLSDIILGGPDSISSNEKISDYYAAREVLIGFIILLFEITPKSECKIKNLLELWRLYQAHRRRFLMKIRYGYVEISERIVRLDKEDENSEGIERLISAAFNRIGSDSEFVDFLSRHWVDVNCAVEKTAVYIILPPTNDLYHRMAGFLIEQINDVIVSRMSRSQVEPVKMNYIASEFDYCPKGVEPYIVPDNFEGEINDMIHPGKLLQEGPVWPVKTMSEDVFYYPELDLDKELYSISYDSVLKTIERNKPYDPEEKSELEKRKKWVIASYNDVIVDSMVCLDGDIADKMQFAARLVKKYGLDEVKRFKWHWGDLSLMDRAERIFKKTPNRVAWTVTEFENITGSYFNDANNVLVDIKVCTKEEIDNLPDVPTIRLRAVLEDIIFGESRSESELDTVDIEDLHIARECALKMFFRRADELLENTAFSRAKWDNVPTNDEDLLIFDKDINLKRRSCLKIEKIK